MEFRDLKSQYKKYKTQIDEAVQKVMLNANYINGKEVRDLEKRLAEYVGVKHCISCANGTEAMTMVLMAWDIKEGDAVFVPDFTFFSTAEVVAARGATPVFVDVDNRTFNIDPLVLESAINQVRSEGKLIPRAIIPVDLYGLPADYPAIEKIANKYNLLVLEDGAQGFGGSIVGKRVCSFGHIATTSFFPAKPLGCYGDGGAVFTNDNDLAELISSYKVHGKGTSKYDNVRVGLNSRLDTIQAAILNVKLDAFIEHELDDVNRIYIMYNQYLNNIVEVPFIPDQYISSFAQYTIKLNNRKQRDLLIEYLKDHNIPSMVYYSKPMHRQSAFRNLGFQDEYFPVTNHHCDTVLSLPMHPYLTDEEIKKVCMCIEDFFRQHIFQIQT